MRPRPGSGEAFFAPKNPVPGLANRLSGVAHAKDIKLVHLRRAGCRRRARQGRLGISARAARLVHCVQDEASLRAS